MATTSVTLGARRLFALQTASRVAGPRRWASAASAAKVDADAIAQLPPVAFVPREPELGPLVRGNFPWWRLAGDMLTPPAALPRQPLNEALRILRALAKKEETFSLNAATSTVDKSVCPRAFRAPSSPAPLPLTPRAAPEQKKKKVARDQFSRVVVLPHTIRPKQKVVAFVEDSLVAGALANGAVAAGGRELIPRIASGEITFDLVVASPEMALALKADASVLKRNMPSAKKGTVSDKVRGRPGRRRQPGVACLPTSTHPLTRATSPTSPADSAAHSAVCERHALQDAPQRPDQHRHWQDLVFRRANDGKRRRVPG